MDRDLLKSFIERVQALEEEKASIARSRIHRDRLGVSQSMLAWNNPSWFTLNFGASDETLRGGQRIKQTPRIPCGSTANNHGIVTLQKSEAVRRARHRPCTQGDLPVIDRRGSN
jgi:hypothetical protein